MQIEGKRVLVTGASRGLGRTLVFAFAQAGASEVSAGTRRQEDRDALKAEASQLSLKITPVQLEVRSQADVDAVRPLGPVDIVGAHAGVAGYGNPVTMDFDRIEEEMTVNYLGTVRMTQAF